MSGSYNDPKVGLIGETAFNRKLKAQGQPPENLDDEEGYQHMKPLITNYPRRATYTHKIDEFWQSDLGDMKWHIKNNDGYRYFLVVIDTFSKYLWTVPLKTKSAAEVSEAFARILKPNLHPEHLQTDQGNEFFNNTMKALLKKFHVHHFFTHSDVKATMAERVIRTMKERIVRYSRAHNTDTWYKVLPDLTENYNTTWHSTIKMKPIDARDPKNSPTVLANLQAKWDKIPKERPRFQVGDYVRMMVAKDAFANTSKIIRWTEEVFKITGIHPTIPITYEVSDLKGEKFKGPIYNDDLQKVAKPDDTKLRPVEKIVARRRIGGVNQVKVRWQGHSEKFDSWVDADQVEDL